MSLSALLLRRLLRPPAPLLRAPLLRAAPQRAATTPSSSPALSQAPPPPPAWHTPWRGTWASPVPIASRVGAAERVVACSGRAGAPHATQYLVARAGRRCVCDHPGCRQVFLLERAAPETGLAELGQPRRP